MAAPKESWRSKSVKNDKPWGNTIDWHALQTIHGKVITIHKGERTSLKYHSVKNEVFFVLRGLVKATHGNSKTLKNGEKYPYQVSILKPGDILTVQSECPYRLEALEESEIIEVGDRSDNEPTRLEDDYGRAKKE
jgi:mannose-6-phosphate isomerase-like protein (cupin superfamily)